MVDQRGVYNSLNDCSTLLMEAQGSAYKRRASNIRRAYRNRCMKLICVCLTFSRVAPQFAHEDVERRRVLRACDLALHSAFDSPQKVIDEANKCFEEATKVLCKHFERWHCRRFLLTKEWLYANDKDKLRQEMMINFVLLRSPLAALHGPETVIVRQMLSAKPSLPEILWNFSRYNLKDRARITLEQNPHFYSSLPTDESAFTNMFTCHPLGDFSVLKPSGTVYVLVDKPDCVFVESKGEQRRFGNVWALNGTLIFKDRTGVLEGEQSVRSFGVRRSLRYSKSLPRSNLSSLWPIMTTPSADLASWTLKDWTVLRLPRSCSRNIYIYDTQDIQWLSRPSSSRDVDTFLPPTSERPEYPVLYTTIQSLNDDILLSIFAYYRLVDAENWNVRRGWCKLSHVCRRWRHLVYESVSHLNMHLLCTNGSPVVHMLTHLPPMPLVIDYQYATTAFDAPEMRGIFHALQIRDRVRRVALHMPASSLDDLLVLMDEPFPVLEQLTIMSTTGGTGPRLPETFLAPNLRHLTLSDTILPGESMFLSTVSLVTLTLKNIRATGYFLPKHLATHLGSFSQLEELTIGFSVPLPRPISERELSDALENPVTLPTLRRFMFQGVSAYLDSFVVQIRAPLLEQLSITLFNQIAFALPHLSEFTNAIQGLKIPFAKVIFKNDGVSVVTKHRTQQLGERNSGFSLRVICKQFDWQIDSAAQICSALMPMLSAVEELTLEMEGKEIPAEWRNGVIDDVTWHELLRPFVGANTLHVCRILGWELSRALQSHDVGLDPELLPVLQTLVHQLDVESGQNAFASFVDARRIADRPVRLLSQVPAAPQLEGLLWLLSSSHPSKSSIRCTRLVPMEIFFPRTISPSLESIFSLLLKQRGLSWIQAWAKDLEILCTLPVRIEDVLPPPQTARPVRGSVMIQPPPPKHIRYRIRPSHKGAGSAWR